MSDLFHDGVPLAAAALRRHRRRWRAAGLEWGEARQEMLVILWRCSLHWREGGGAAFRTYYYSAVHRWMLRPLLKQERFERAMPGLPRGRPGEGRDVECAGLDEPADEAAARREEGPLLSAALREALAALPERDREVALRRGRGETFQAIGASLGVSKRRALQLWERALRMLREGMAAWLE